MDIFAVLLSFSAYLLLRTVWLTPRLDSVCNIYVLIAVDTRFRRTKGSLAFIITFVHHPWHGPIFPLFELVGLESRVYCLFTGARFLLHCPSQYQCNHIHF